MAQRYDPRVNLEYYTREAVRNADVWTDSAVRAEYSRLRDIAQKRLQRLAKSEPGSYAYRANVGQYAPARGQTTEEIRTKLPTLAKFIAAKTGSVSGIRAQRSKAVKTFQEHGYNFITKENIGTFGEFMEAFKSKKGKTRAYGSYEAVELWEFTQEQNIDPERVKRQFAQWLQQRKELEEYVTRQHKAGEEVSADDVIREFNRLDKQRIEREKGKALLDVISTPGINEQKVDKDYNAWMRQAKALQKFQQKEKAAGREVTAKDIEREFKRLEKVRQQKNAARRKKAAEKRKAAVKGKR